MHSASSQPDDLARAGTAGPDRPRQPGCRQPGNRRAAAASARLPGRRPASRRPRRVRAWRTVHAAARMCRRRRQVQRLDRRLRSPEPRNGTQDQLLVQAGRPGVHRAGVQAPVVLRHRARRLDRPGEDELTEPGREPFHVRLHAVGEQLRVPVVPATGDAGTPCVTLRALRYVRVAPHGFGAGRRPGRVGRRHLPQDEHRLRRDEPHREVSGERGHRIHPAGDVDGAGPSGIPGSPGNGPPQGPVDLYGRVVPVEPPQVARQRRRQQLLADELAEQLRGIDVGEDGSRGIHARPVGKPHRYCPPAANHHLGDPGTAAHLAAPGAQSARQGAGKLPRPSRRRRKPGGLPEHAQQPAEQAAARGVGPEIGVQSVAAEQRGSAGARELLVAQPADGQQRHPGEPQGVPRPEAGEQPQAVSHGREGREQRPEQRVLQACPEPVQPPPRVAVARGESVQRRGGLVDVTGDDRARTVRAGVGQHERCTAPPQPMPFEMQAGDDGRNRGERIEAAEQVGDEPR